MNEIVETLQGMLADCRAIHRDTWPSVARLERRLHTVRALFRDVEYPNKEQRHAMRELCDYCEEFLEQTERLEDDFLFTLNRKHKHRDAREGTIERDDPRLPAGILAGEIIDAIEAFSDPVVVQATPAIMPATPVVAQDAPAPVASAPSDHWFEKANKSYKRDILKQVDEWLRGASTKTEFYDDAKEFRTGDGIIRLASELNKILTEAGKDCRFSALNSGSRLSLMAGPATTKERRKKTKTKSTKKRQRNDNK